MGLRVSHGFARPARLEGRASDVVVYNPDARVRGRWWSLILPRLSVQPSWLSG